MNDKDVNSEIVVYQPDEVTRLEVRVEGETVWLTVFKAEHKPAYQQCLQGGRVG